MNQIENNGTDSGSTTDTATCKTGTCDILMIIFGCIGFCLLIAYVVVVVRYNIRSKEEKAPIATTLVG